MISYVAKGDIPDIVYVPVKGGRKRRLWELFRRPFHRTLAMASPLWALTPSFNGFEPPCKLVVRWRRLIHFPSQLAEFSSQYRFITVD